MGLKRYAPGVVDRLEKELDAIDAEMARLGAEREKVITAINAMRATMPVAQEASTS